MFLGQPQSPEDEERKRLEREATLARLNSAGVGSKWGGFQIDSDGMLRVKDTRAFQNIYNSFLNQARGS